MPAKLYAKVDKDVDRLLRTIIDYHPGLRENKVTICALFVYLVDDDGKTVGEPCLDHHGYPAAAVVRINPYPKRVEGLADATLIIDKHCWDALGPANQTALIDHEMLHLQVKEKKGVVQHDDLGRPVLKIRKHDFQIGGFYAICERHKAAALEHAQLSEVAQVFVQMELPFTVG